MERRLCAGSPHPMSTGSRSGARGPRRAGADQGNNVLEEGQVWRNDGQAAPRP